MNATDVDPVKIQNALWYLVKDAEVSDNIFVGNRPASSELDDFVVVDLNGVVRDLAGHARCTCLVQLFAKDIDQNGTENMTRLSEMYASLLGGLPYNAAPYTFSKKNQVGRRDSLGFHATLVNLDCLIY
jgi:hypothetical protein